MPSSTLWTGQTLGQYEILDLIGSGGMGQVYRARHTLLGRDAAIKFLRRPLASPSERAEDAENDARFVREAQAIARLRHPRIVQLYDFGIYDEAYYMVLEYVEGESLAMRLRQLHKSGTRLPQSQIQTIIADVADALSYIHTQGMVHRDIKPANILLDEADHAFLADFGIVRLLTQTGGTTDHALGTPAYMAPEQIKNDSVDERTDLYALAVVVYEMLAGRRPFEAAQPAALAYQHVHEPPPALRQFAPQLPTQVEVVVRKALSKAPQSRYLNVTGFYEALARAWTETGPPDVTWETQVIPSDSPYGNAEAGIPPTLNTRLMAALLRSAPLESDRALQAVFVDARIRQWRDYVPEAKTRAERVQQVVACLSEHFNIDNENALVLFLQVLSDQIPPADTLHRDLTALAADLAPLLHPPPRLETPPTPTPATTTSPFRVGGPIENDTNFYGRRAETRYILDRLTQGGCTSVVGERRIGKSSLLRYVQRHAGEWLSDSKRGDISIYLDLMRPSTHTRRGLMHALRRRLEDTGALPVWSQDEDGDLIALEDTLEDWRAAGQSLTLLLDEVDRLTERAAEFNDLLDLWRVYGQGPTLNIVTASRLPLADLVQHGNLSSPFHNIFIERCLGLLAEAEWHRLIREGLTQRALRMPPGALAWISEVAGGHPFFTQLAADVLYQSWRSGAHLALDYPALTEQFTVQARAHLAHLWRHLDMRDKATLHALAETVPASHTAASTVGALERRGLLRNGRPFSTVWAQGIREGWWE